MQTFNDGQGEPWMLDFVLGDFEKIKAATGLDLLRPDAAPDDFNRLFGGGDFGLLTRVLESALAPEISRRGLTTEDFRRRLRGDALDAALRAFIAAYADFFPTSRRKQILGILDALTAAEQALQTGAASGVLPPAPGSAPTGAA